MYFGGEHMMIGLIAMLGVLGGVADDGPYKTYDGGWNLYRNDDNCALLRTYGSDTILRIAYFPKEDSVRVAVVDPELKNVVDGGDYKFQLYFLNGDAIDKGWGTVSLKGVKLEGLGPGYRFLVSGKAFLADLGKNKILGLMDGDDVIESLKLDSQTAPLDGLQSCANAMH